VYGFTVATPAPAGSRAVEISAACGSPRRTTAHKVFGDATTGALASLHGISQRRSILATATPSPRRYPGVDTGVSGHGRALVADVGARSQQLETIDALHQARATQLTADTSNLQDVRRRDGHDGTRRTANSAASGDGRDGAIFGISLTDYLK